MSESEPEPAPEPIEEPTPEPAVEPTPEPIEEPTPEPVQEPTPEPVVEPTPEPIEEPTQEPIEEPTPEPVEEPTPEPIEEPTPEPIEEPTPEPIEEPTPEPIEEPTPEPVEEPIPEPVVEPIEEPTPEPVVEPIEEPVPEPVEEPTPEPAPEPAVEDGKKTISVSERELNLMSTPVHSSFVTDSIPNLVIIVPYRDRDEQRKFFDLHMRTVLEDYNYRIIYVHQTDNRSFNRGAMKNIGFTYVKSIYKEHYKDITFVFNDVDTMPYTKTLLNYNTTTGIVKHFYGYTFTLGGIVSIKGSDFEKTNGFPNYWAWGYEDNAFQNRVVQAGLSIDRTNFFPIMDKNILQLKDGITRIVNRGEYDKYVNEVQSHNVFDGVNSLYDLSYHADDSFLHVTTFQTPTPENPQLTKIHDMRDGNIPFRRKPSRNHPRMKMHFG